MRPPKCVGPAQRAPEVHASPVRPPNCVSYALCPPKYVHPTRSVRPPRFDPLPRPFPGAPTRVPKPHRPPLTHPGWAPGCQAGRTAAARGLPGAPWCAPRRTVSVPGVARGRRRREGHPRGGAGSGCSAVAPPRPQLSPLAAAPPLGHREPQGQGTRSGGGARPVSPAPKVEGRVSTLPPLFNGDPPGRPL